MNTLRNAGVEYVQFLPLIYNEIDDFENLKYMIM